MKDRLPCRKTSVWFRKLEGEEEYKAVRRIIRKLKTKYPNDEYIGKYLDKIGDRARGIMNNLYSIYYETYPISQLHLSSRTENELYKRNIYTIYDLLQHSAGLTTGHDFKNDGMSDIRLKMKDIHEVKNGLKRYGLKMPIDFTDPKTLAIWSKIK